jgi:hypothetical protein
MLGSVKYRKRFDWTMNSLKSCMCALLKAMKQDAIGIWCEYGNYGTKNPRKVAKASA